MSYDIYKIHFDGEEYVHDDKISKVLEINWQDDIEKVFIPFDFSTTEELEVGQWIELYEKDENIAVFRGVITNYSKQQEEIYTYSGYDIGFYLEKNKDVTQFRGQKISQAIKDICTRFELPIAQTFYSIDTTVRKIYNNVQLSEIVLDLLQLAKDKDVKFKNYCIDCRMGFINILRYTENNNLHAYLANLYSAKSLDLITGYDINHSIEDLKTKVVVVNTVKDSEKEKMPERKAAPNEDAIKKYGILQEVIELDRDKKVNYEEVAQKKLDELCKVKETISLTFMSDHHAHKGVIISIDNEELHLNDKYLIKTSKHKITQSKEEVVVNIQKYNEDN